MSKTKELNEQADSALGKGSEREQTENGYHHYKCEPCMQYEGGSTDPKGACAYGIKQEGNQWPTCPYVNVGTTLAILKPKLLRHMLLDRVNTRVNHWMSDCEAIVKKRGLFAKVVYHDLVYWNAHTLVNRELKQVSSIRELIDYDIGFFKRRELQTVIESQLRAKKLHVGNFPYKLSLRVEDLAFLIRYQQLVQGK